MKISPKNKLLSSSPGVLRWVGRIDVIKTDHSLTTWISIVVVLILFVTAFSKTVAMFGSERYLEDYDSITRLKYRHLLAGVAAFEFVIARLFWKWRSVPLGPLALLSLCVVFCFYRIVFYSLYPGEMCPCVGHLLAGLNLSKSSLNKIMDFVLCFLVASGLGLFLLNVLKSLKIAGRKS